MSAFDPKRTSSGRVPAVQATMGGTEPYVAMLGRNMTAGEEESVSGKSGWHTSKLPRHAMNSRTLIPLGLRPQPIDKPTRDLCGRLHGDREHRTDVDLAKHVAVDSVRARRAEHEIRIPDHRKVVLRDGQ